MTLQEIKQAILSGKTVHWCNERYTVKIGAADYFYIIDKYNGSCVGLTYRDGITLNGSQDQFYIA